MSVLATVAVVVLVIAVVVRRFVGTPLTTADLVGGPVVIVAIGLWSLGKVAMTPLDGAWLGVALAVGLVIGGLRGTTPALSVRHGALRQRYRITTLAVWVLGTAASFGLALLAGSAGAHPEARPMALTIGVGMLGETLTLGLRALSTGVPFAPRTGSSEHWADTLVTRLRAARPAPRRVDLDRDPTLRDGLAWLRGAGHPR